MGPPQPLVGLPGRRGQAHGQQQGADLGGEGLVGGGEAGDAVQDRAVSLEEARAGTRCRRAGRWPRGSPTGPCGTQPLPLWSAFGRLLRESRGLPPAGQPDGLQGDLAVALLLA